VGKLGAAPQFAALDVEWESSKRWDLRRTPEANADSSKSSGYRKKKES